MDKVLSKLPSPALAGVVKEKTKDAAIAEIKNCMYDGADMIDLHLSCLEDITDDSLKGIFASSRLPVLALNYNTTYNRQDAQYSENERAELFLKAVECGAAGVDMQGYTFHCPSKDDFCGEDKFSFTKGKPKEVVTDEKIISRQSEFIERIHSKGGEVLLSCHPGIPMTAEQVVDLSLFLEKRAPDIIKIVTVAKNEDDLLESFKAMVMLKREVKTKVSYHAAGVPGSLSRIINPVLGGHIVFCVDRFSESSTMEQLDLKTVRTIIENMKKVM